MKKRGIFRNKTTRVLLFILGVFAITAIILIISGNFGFQAETNVPASVTKNKAIGRAPDKFTPGRILVKFRSEVSKEKANKILEGYGVSEEKEISQIGVKILKLPGKADEKAYLNALQNRKEIEFAELDYALEPQAIPNDRYYSQQWGLPKIQAPAAWDITKGENVTIAILDTGIDLDHPDLTQKLVPGYNSFDGSDQTYDVTGHGTIVAGLAAATTNNQIGVAGAAWDAKIMPVRITDAGGYGDAYPSAIASGLIWAADHGARVANISYRVSSGYPTITEAARYFMDKGGVVTSSAGYVYKEDPNPDNPFILTVNATDINDANAWFSGTGNNIDVTAPGDFYGWTVATKNGGDYGQCSGTSYSTAIVSGVAALAISANPSLSGYQIADVIKKSADDLGTAGWDTSFGWGKVNAAQAVSASKNTFPETTPPITTIVTPSDNAVISEIIAPKVRVTDNKDIASATLTLDNLTDLNLTNTEVTSEINKTFTFSLDPALLSYGRHTLTAIGKDGSGNTSQATITINVVNPADTTAPTVTIDSPSNGAVVKDYTKVFASAKDDSGVAQVDFYSNDKLIGSTKTSPYYISWNTYRDGNGSFTLSAKAMDNYGNVGVSSSITVTVSNTVTGDLTLPTATISNPANNTTLTSNVKVNVTATDDVKIRQTDLYLDGIQVGSSAKSTLSYTLNYTKLSSGAHFLQARAIDTWGNFAYSTVVTVFKK